jgi:GT2 family glycosyltransferase
LHGLAGHIGNNWEENDLGYYGYNQIARRVSAVTGACLLCRKADYQSLGGLDAQAFPVAFNDVDFCLRLRRHGLHIIWTPLATLLHSESVSRGMDDTPEKSARLAKEKSEMIKRWGESIYFDPYYNQNLNLDRYAFDGLAFPPREKI